VSGTCAGNMVGVRQAGLEVTDDRAEKPRCEKPRTQGTGRILTNGRKLSQGGPGCRRHVTKLPADLLTNSVWPVWGGQTSCLDGVGGGAQGVRAHMGDGCDLSGRSGSGRGCRSAHLTSGASILKASADFLGDVKLAMSKSPRPGDRLTGPAIGRRLRLEQSQHPLRTVRRPQRDDPPVGFAQRLRRTHMQSLSRVLR
jgi:hypothetical protein